MDAVIPKSSDPQRMRENLDVFPFEFSTDDLASLATLDGGPLSDARPGVADLVAPRIPRCSACIRRSNG
jgi:diketogulonate reductase-like aldo/keto reductase